MMQALLLEINHKDEWNSLALQEPYFALMQSWEWGEYKEELGWRAFRIGVEESGSLIAGAQLLIKKFPLGLASIAYIPRGPIGNWQDDRVFTTLFDNINKIARSFHSIFLKIEPSVPPDPKIDDLLYKNNFRRSHHATQPLATIILNISQEDDCILQGMRKSTRRKVYSAERKGIKVCPGGYEHLDAFYQLMRITGERCGFTTKSFDHYMNEWRTFNECNRAGFFLAYFQDTLIAAHIAYTFGPHAAFFHQASSTEYSNLNANCLLVWEEIKWAKSRNCGSYDLWGVPDDICESRTEDEESAEADRTDGLWGVYKFKRGFCKNIVTFTGSFDLVYKPLLYASIMNDLVNEKTIDRAQVWLEHHL